MKQNYNNMMIKQLTPLETPPPHPPIPTPPSPPHLTNADVDFGIFRATSISLNAFSRTLICSALFSGVGNRE